MMRRSGSDDLETSVAIVNDATDLTWTFQVKGIQVEWIWQERGDPPLRDLEPVRRPTSSKRNRHIPVTAYSTKDRRMLALESGLEHDLMRKLDRDPTIAWIVPQPLRLAWNSPELKQHTPDFISVDSSDAVTVWDARGTEEQNEDFATKSAVTRAGCLSVGWLYEVFDGFGKIERLNHLWLYGFRRRPAWAGEFEESIRRLAGVPDATLGGLMAASDDAGLMKTVIWHFLWSGKLYVNMAERWTDETSVYTPLGRLA